MKKMNNKKVTFFAFLLSIVMLIGFGMPGRECEVFAAEFPYYGTLDIQWKGWKAYNTGINYNLTGGTAGTLRQGDKLKVIDEKKNAGGNMVSYCYSEDLGRYCYVTSKYILRTETEEERTVITQKMEEQYGEDYYSLFEEAPEFLSGSVAESYELKCMEYCRDVLDKQAESIGTGAFWEVLVNGKNIVRNELLAWGGVSLSTEEKYHMEAARYLLSTLYDSEGSNADDIKDTAEWLSVAEGVEKLQSYVDPSAQLYQDLELVKREAGKTDMMSEYIGSSASGEYAKTAYLISYYWELESAFNQMKIDIMQKDTEVTYEEIGSFEELYYVKNGTLHAVLEYCKSVEGASKYSDLLSADTVTYETYVSSCMKNYREARKKIVLDVPLYTQTTTYTCGVSNVKMILDYLGITSDGKAVSESALWNWANLYGEGTYVYRVAQTLRKYGAPYQYVSVAKDTTETYWSRLESSLKSGCPVIVLIYPEKNEYWDYSSGHYVLVTGIYRTADNTPYAVINDCHYKYGEQGKEVPLAELLKANKRHSSYIILGNNE